MGKISKWSPLRIPGAFRQYADDGGSGSGDPMDSWDASDWENPDEQGWKARITPNHAGQWLILGAVLLFAMGFILWIGQFSQATHQNPWTLVATLWPASLFGVYVYGRERGFQANQALDWTFITTGRSVRVLAGKFVERFGEGDVKHVKFTPIKTRSYGAFRFKTLKLGDLEANRDKLMSKATGSNRGPKDDARIELPGPLTGENTNTILGRVFGVHGGAVEFHDSGHEVDMRVTNPSTLDEDIAADVLSQLELFDQRIIPELKSEIQTVETQKNRYKQRAEAERDPELDRMFSAVDTMSQLINRRGRSTSSDEDDEVDEITEKAREQVES